MTYDYDEAAATAKERGWRELAPIEQAFAEGRIDRAQWHAAVLDLIEPAYIAGANPRAQSGHSGDETQWQRARRLLTKGLPAMEPAAYDRELSFLDVGCANGHLMESLVEWAAQDRIRLEPYGVEISPALADLARSRLPQWAGRIWAANAMDWRPPRRFDVVRTGLDYVPAIARPEFLAHLLDHVVARSGRLIVGVYNEEHDRENLRDQVSDFGYTIAGFTCGPHAHPEIRYKAFWIENRG